MAATTLRAAAALICVILTGAASAAEGVSPGDTLLETLQNPGSNRIAVTVFDVGAGSCALISCPNGKKILMDCGSSTTNKDKSRIERSQHFFNQIVGEDDIEAIILSHPDVDHINLVNIFISGLRPEHHAPPTIGTVMLGGPSKKHKNHFKNWESQITAAEKETRTEGTRFVLHENGDGYDSKAPYPEIDCGSDDNERDGIHILAINNGKNKSDTNANSIVAMLNFGDKNPFRMLFPGDALKETENHVLNSHSEQLALLKTDVALADHHGASGTNQYVWIEAIAPEAVIYSAGRKHGHPHCETVERYSKVVKNDWGKHPLSCGKSPKEETSKGHFNTRDSGTIVAIHDKSTNRTTIYGCEEQEFEKCKPFQRQGERGETERPAIESTEEEGPPRKRPRTTGA